MKKILSVALSTAMAFSMFASVAFGADAKLTPEQQFNTLKEAGIVSGFPDGLSHLEKTLTRAELAKIIVNSLSLEPVDATSYNDKNYANHWGRTYIEAATQAGILNGKDAAKKLFDPNGAVTVQELAKVLVTALKLEVPADANNTASAWAKGYVAAAVNAGYLADGINYQAQATRSQAVVAAYAIYEAAQVPTVTKYEVKDSKNIEFTLSNDEVVKVTLEKELVPNTATDVTFKTAAGEEIKTSVTWVLTTATKVEKVTADNLKQVAVTFDGEVDEATATDANNYSIAGKTIDSASLSADKKVVTLTLDTNAGTAFVNQQEYKLTFNNVKAGSKVLNVSDYKFTPVDTAYPTATAAVTLGNQTLKVTFSEPIKTSTVSNFQVDGKTVAGYTTVKGNVVIVKLYTKLDTGAHTITVKDVQDYMNLKSLSQTLDVNVVEDTTAPTASFEKGTFEKVTIKFSEPVDEATVLAGNVYWLQGTAKKYPVSVKAVSDDTYEFNFSNNPIQYATDLYITGVKDYSGNLIAADTKVQVNPVVDTVRPEVVNVVVDNSKNITVKFSKSLDLTSAQKSENYVIKDADGKVVSALKTVTRQTDTKVVKIQLAQALSEGKTYTLAISGVSDDTLLKNVILPYTTSITITDKGAPTVNTTSIANVANNTIAISVSEAVAVSGDGNALDKSKYLYQLTTDSATNWRNLPDGTGINVSPDGKAILLTFPSDVNVGTIAKVRVQLIKDLADNYIAGLTQDTTVASSGTVSTAISTVKATATNKIEVAFGATVLLSNSVNASDFTVTDTSGDAVSILSAAIKDDTKVELTLADSSKLRADAKSNDASGNEVVKVYVKANATTSTPSGIPIVANTTGVTVDDAIAATVSSTSGSVDGKSVKLTFNEALLSVAGTESELVIKDKDSNVIAPADYTVTMSGNDLIVTFANVQSGIVTVSLPAPRTIVDASTPANVVAPVAVNDGFQIDVDNAVPAVSIPAVTGVGTNDAATLVITATESLFDATTHTVLPTNVVTYFDGAAAGKIATAVYNDAAKTITLTFTTPVAGDVISTLNLEDHEGNSFTNQKFTYDATGTKWVQANK